MSKTFSLSAGRPSTKRSQAATLANLSDEDAITRMSFELSVLHHMKLKVYAAKQGKSIRDVLTEFVEGLPE